MSAMEPSNNGVELRPATPADAEALAQLGRESFIAKFGHLYSAADLASFLNTAHDTAYVASEITNPGRRVMLATRDGELAGYCKIGLTCGFPDHARGLRTMELKQLYTAAGATGGGIGGTLMDWAMAALKQAGADEVQLSVYAENHGAHRFYARYGFEKVADITFLVGEHVDPEYLFARMI